MSLIEALLVIIVLVVIYLYICRIKLGTAPNSVAPTGTAPVPPASVASNHGLACLCLDCSPEAKTTKENTEYFSGQLDTASKNGHHTNDDGIEYFVDEYGQDKDYKEWVTDQVVDDQTRKYHGEFVKDVLTHNPGAGTIGRTYMADSHDSYDPVSWQGLRRISPVPVNNPTQVADINYKLYESRNRISW